MTTSPPPKPGERVADVRLDDDTLSVDLADGRTITVPLAWYPRLLDATPTRRAECVFYHGRMTTTTPAKARIAASSLRRVKGSFRISAAMIRAKMVEV